MSIRRLPDDVIDKIKSSVIISCLNDVGCGLIKNSLDAGAIKVDVYLDYAKGNCTVQDNGDGIAADEFQVEGGLGKLHHSSRLPPCAEVYGSRGDFLASVATLSLLNITSHQIQHVSHNSVTFHQGKVISRDTPARLDQRFMSYRHGTRVTIRNLFGSMPVRVKHRSATFTDRSDVDKEFRKLIDEVVALLVAWPRSVALTLKETQSQKEIRIRSPGHQVDISTCISRLAVQSGILDALHDTDVVPVMADANGISIQGCISRAPVSNRRCQGISIGIHPVKNPYGTNVLYEVVNKMFAASDFGRVNSAAAETTASQEISGHLKPRKGTDRWPLYYFQISFGQPKQSDVEDVLNERGTRMAELEHLLALICYQFLRKHHFRPKKPGIVAKRQRRQPNTPSGTAREQLAHGSQTNIRGHDAKRGDESQLLERFTSMHRSVVGLGTYPDDSVAETGAFDLGSRVAKKSFRIKTKLPRPESSTWLESILENWKNPVFEPSENLMTRLETPESSQHGNNVYFDSRSIAMNSRVSRSALANAQVISQVDNKFILIRISLEGASSDNPTGLFMIDQHAADERCRVEELMRNYFDTNNPGDLQANMETLESPILLRLSSSEVAALEVSRRHFSLWGIEFDIARKQSLKGHKRDDAHAEQVVSILKLPPSILERCRAEPQLLEGILRDEASVDTERIIYPGKQTSTTTGGASLPSFSGCPRGILDLLNSRSCRGAIMFNDKLTISECENLVRRLSQCSFPFQCAHGRPSMAPLLDLGANNNVGGWFEDYGSKEDSKKWKEWYIRSSSSSDSDISMG